MGRLMQNFEAAEQASIEEQTRLLSCLENETMLRLFLTGAISGPLSIGSSGCIREVTEGIDLSALMLSGASGDEQTSATARVGGMTMLAFCLNEDEWRGVAASMGLAPEDREVLKCALDELGGPGALAETLRTGDEGSSLSLLEAARGCDVRTVGGSPVPDDALLWQYETGNPDELLTVSANVANGVVYAGSYGGLVYALDAGTGELLWTFETESGLNPPPTVAGRVVYAKAPDNLYALDASTGELLSSDDSVYEELLLSDGTLYFPTWRIDGDLSVHIRAVDAASGEELWTADVPRSSELPLLFPVTASGEKVFVSDDSQVRALDSATGEPSWSFDAGDVVQDPPAASNGAVYLRSYSAAHAVDESTGEQLWSYEIEHGGLGDRPAYIVDGVWPLVEFGVLHALDAATGQPLWSFDEDPVTFVSGVADGMVFVTGSEAFHALDAATGKELWNLDADWGIGEVTVIDGVLYANSLDGYLHTLDAWTGKPLWSVHIGYHLGGTTKPYTVWGGVVYVGYQLDDSGIYAFNAPGGR